MAADPGAQPALAENPYKNVSVCRALPVVKSPAMSSPPPQRHRRRLGPVVAAVLLTAVLALLSGAATAGADQITDKRAEARQAEAQLNDLYAQQDKAVEAFDAAHAKLAKVNGEIRSNHALLVAAKHNLAEARAQLASIVISAYKGDDQNAAMYVLAAQSFTDLVDRVDVLNRTSHDESSILHRVTVAEHQVAHRQVLLRQERKQARKLVRQAAAARRRAAALISSQQAKISQLKAQINQLVGERKARLAREARERAAAARAAAAAAAAPPPSPSPSPAPVEPPSGAPVPPASSVGEQAVQIAMGELGVPYVWGGASPAGFDCSGLTMWVYAQLGIQLDHYTGSQWTAGVPVPYDQLAPGDLVFFEPDIGHVGIYIGNGEFIHAPHTGTVVQISSLSDSWYAAEYQGARRVTG
jgi:cell wall-associated NlpC family hydrolase